MVGSEDINPEFAPEFYGVTDLAAELRSVLFPIRGRLFTGACKDRSIMHDETIHAFDKAISCLGKKSRG